MRHVLRLDDDGTYAKRDAYSGARPNNGELCCAVNQFGHALGSLELGNRYRILTINGQFGNAQVEQRLLLYRPLAKRGEYVADVVEKDAVRPDHKNS